MQPHISFKDWCVMSKVVDGTETIEVGSYRYKCGDHRINCTGLGDPAYDTNTILCTTLNRLTGDPAEEYKITRGSNDTLCSIGDTAALDKDICHEVMCSCTHDAHGKTCEIGTEDNTLLLANKDKMPGCCLFEEAVRINQKNALRSFSIPDSGGLNELFMSFGSYLFLLLLIIIIYLRLFLCIFRSIQSFS